MLPLPKEVEDDQRAQQRRRGRLRQRYVCGMFLEFCYDSSDEVEVAMLENVLKFACNEKCVLVLLWLMTSLVVFNCAVYLVTLQCLCN